VSAKVGCVARFFTTHPGWRRGRTPRAKGSGRSLLGCRGSRMPGEILAGAALNGALAVQGSPSIPTPHTPGNWGCRLGDPERVNASKLQAEGRWLNAVGGGENPPRGLGEHISRDTRAGQPELFRREAGGHGERSYVSGVRGKLPKGGRNRASRIAGWKGAGAVPVLPASRPPGARPLLLCGVPGASEPRTGKGSKKEGKKGGRRQPGLAIAF